MVLSLITRSLLPKIQTSSRTFSVFNTTTIATNGLILPTAQRIFGADHNVCENLVNYVQSRGAARKGKRIQRSREARLRANKRRLLEAQNPKQKKQFKKNVKVDKNQFRFLNERQLDTTLANPPEDNVYFMENFRKKRYAFETIIEFHKQAVHPDVLNLPESLVTATIELNLKMKIKKKKYIEHINSTVCYPHHFQYEARPRKIVALCQDEAQQEAAREAGAILAGSLDIANLLKTNQLSHRDFDHLVCHTDFLTDFAAVKGMKGSSFFPSKQRGNFGDNIVELVKYFKNGLDYTLKKDVEDPSFGIIDCYFGKLNMTTEQLRENLLTLFRSIDRFRPINLADNKQFYERVIITTPATNEIFLLKFWELHSEYQDPELLNLEEPDENKDKQVARG